MSDQQDQTSSSDLNEEEEKGNFVVEYFKSFKLLKETRSDYWGMQVVNFIDHTIFFALITIAVIFFSDNPDKFGFGLSDSHAGYIFAIFGSITTISLFFTGLVSDWLGIRKSMILNQVAMLLLRGGIVWLAFNQSFFSGDISLEVAENGEQITLIDSSGGSGAMQVRGAGANGEQSAAALGFLELDGSVQARGTGLVLEKPEKKAVVTIGDLTNRLLAAKGNDEKLEAKISSDGTRLLLTDLTGGDGRFTVVDSEGSTTARALGLPVTAGDGEKEIVGADIFDSFSLDAFRPELKLSELNRGKGVAIVDNQVDFTITTRDGTVFEVNLGRTNAPLTESSLLADFREGKGVPLDVQAEVPDLAIQARDGHEYLIDLTGITTVGDLIARVESKTQGHITLALDDGQRLKVTDTRGGSEDLIVYGAGANGTQAAKALGLYNYSDPGWGWLNVFFGGAGGATEDTFDGAAIDYREEQPGTETIQDVIDRLNGLEGNDGKLVAKLSEDGVSLVIVDETTGEGTLQVTDAEESTTAADLGLLGAVDGNAITATGLLADITLEKLSHNTRLSWLNHGEGIPIRPGVVDFTITLRDGTVFPIDLGDTLADLTRNTKLADLMGGNGVLISEDGGNPDFLIVGCDGTEYAINLTEVETVGDLMQRLDDNSGGWAWLVLAILFILQAPFLALGQTAFQAANKRYTSKKSRGAGFNLWYLFMNVGAVLAGLLIDLLHHWLHLPRVHVFTTGIGTAVICIIVILLFVKRETQLYGEGEDPKEKEEDDKKALEKPMSPWTNAKLVLSEPVFWRFTLLITLLLGVRSVFLYMHLLMPKFWLRVIGPDAYIGTLEMINPILVVIGLILLIPILSKFSVYKMLVYGAMISALSLFVLAIPATGHSCYTISILCLIVLTIGEVIWSPRLTEYTAAIAPKGQEGTYLGLSMVPYFFAKTIVGFASGHMLERWVREPKDEAGLELRYALEAGEIGFWDSPSAMWLLLAIPALGGPFIALMLKGFFTKGAHFEKGEGKA